MIKFFRNIRKTLLAEGKTSKYLKYAIGEIVLVVIGILIALWVNNKNNEVKEIKLGMEYLSRIHRDLVHDTLNFRKIIIQNNTLREDIKGLLVSLYNGVDDKEQVKNMSVIYDKALDQVFSVNDNTYLGMVSSGTLGLIKNNELKEEIIKLYSEYDETKTLLNSINEWMISIATTADIETDFMKFNSGVSDIYTTSEMLNESDFSFINDKEGKAFKMLVKAISATAFNQSVRSSYYNQLIGKCASVLILIDKELKE